MPREVHVLTTSKTITAFIDVDRSRIMCFRCGETGHMRCQCLTFKVRLCWHHNEGTCTDPHCSFAHGIQELRTPWKQRCVRVVKQGGKLICIGCNSSEHTFKRCPLYQNILLI